jgi:hypothetical protein
MEPLGTLSDEGGTVNDDIPPGNFSLYFGWISGVGDFLIQNTSMFKKQASVTDRFSVYRKSLGVLCFVDFYQK